MIGFAFENLRKKPKDAAFFAFSIMMTTAIVMIFYCIMNNPYFGKDPTNTLLSDSWYFMFVLDGGIGTGIFTVMLSLIIIGICIMTIFFANNFYLFSKLNDIGIMMISGCPITRITKFLITQNFVIVICMAPLGTLIGYLVSPFMNALIYAQMNIQAPLFSLSSAPFTNTFATLAIICVWLVILDAGFVYRSGSLSDILQTRTRMRRRKLKPFVFHFMYLAMYGASLYLIRIFHVKDVNIILMYYVGALIYFGAVNVFRYVLPAFVGFMQRKYFSANKHRLLSLANLQYSLTSANQLITIILLGASILLYYLCKFYDDPATFMVVLFSYVVILVLDMICIVYKMAVDAISKETVFNRMMCIGYLTSDVKKIIHQEVFAFFALILLVALPQMGLILTMYYEAAYIPLSFIIKILGAFLLALTIGALITIRLYESIILKSQTQNRKWNE